MGKGEPHRGEWSVDSLNNVERKVDAQYIIRRRCAGRQWKEGRDRSCLQEPEVSGGINGPLGILRCSIMGFNLGSQRSRSAYLVIGKAGLVAACSLLDALCATSWRCLNHHPLVAEAALDNLASSSIDHK